MSTLTLTECDTPPTPSCFENAWLCPWVFMLLKGTVKLTDPPPPPAYIRNGWLHDLGLPQTWGYWIIYSITITVFCVSYWLATFLQSWASEFRFAGRQIAVSNRKKMYRISSFIGSGWQYNLWCTIFPSIPAELDWSNNSGLFEYVPFWLCGMIDWWIKEDCYVGFLHTL